MPLSPDGSPVLLRISNYGDRYSFFFRTVWLSNKMIFGETYDPNTFTLEFIKDFNFSRWKTIQSKFAGLDSHSSIIELSLYETLILLGLSDKICKLFIMDDSDAFRSIISASLRDSASNWDESIYIKDTQKMFDEFKNQYKNIPKLIEFLNSITNSQ